MAEKKDVFKSRYRVEKEHFYAPAGEPVELRHEAKFTEDGRRYLTRTRKKLTYDIIQSHREETEVQRIVKRAREGDKSVLNYMNGVYMDVTDAPKSLAQAQQLIINAKQEFGTLPAEIREKFENNEEIYVASVGTKEWFDAMGITAEMENRQMDLKQAKAAAADLASVTQGAGVEITNTGVENE